MEEVGWLFDLASLLGKTVGELLEKVTPGELTMWAFWMKSQPRGDQRHDWQAALTTKAIYDLAGSMGGVANTLGIQDYLLQWKTTDSKLDGESIKARVLASFPGIKKGDKK